MAAPTDTLYGRQWYLQTINAPAVWEDYTGIGVNVGILDFDGIEYTHYDLDANANTDLHLVYQGAVIDPTTAAVRNHATSVAGVISGERNGTGVVGVAYDSTFTAVPLVFNGNDRDPAYFGAVMAHQSAFDVTNLSWNFQPFVTGPSSALWQNIKGGIGAAALTGRGGLGTVMVATPSNDRKGDQWNHGPGDANAAGPHSNDRHVVVVGGVGMDGFVADYSAPGASLLVSAPAMGRWSGSTAANPGIWATDRVGTAGFNNATSPNGGDFVETLGTSFAAPQVAGVVALMLEANPDLGWRDVREILALSARQIGSDIPISRTSPGTLNGAEQYVWTINGATNWNGGGMHFSNDYGFGMVDARAAVRLAETWQSQQTSLNEAHIQNNVFGSVTIPDNNAQGVTTTISMASGIDIETVTLSLDLQHTFARDLTIRLTSPAGTESTLIRRAADGIDINGWEFTSNAFAGEDSGGTWTLRVIDSAGGDVGTYSRVALDVWGSRGSQDDTYFYTDEFGDSGRIANEAQRGTLNDTGGHDTINAAAVTGSVRIDLDGFTASSIAGRNLVVSRGTIEDAIGGDGGDTLIGSAVTNELWGMRGIDTLNGNGGNDILHGGADGDFLNGYADDDTAWGEAGNDTVSGGIGNDILHGGFADEEDSGGGDGDDMVYGEAGNDTLFVSYGRDTLDGGDGIDTLSLAWMGNAQTVDLAAGTANLFESGFLDRNDDGELDSGDSVWGSRITVTWSNMENLTGGSNGDTLSGDGNGNLINGGAGADAMTGRGGGDVYIVDDPGDRVVELASDAGIDTVLSVCSFSLDGQAIENLTLAGSAAINATGNGLANALTGNTGANLLDGRGGADTMKGGAGADVYIVDNPGDKVVELSTDAGTDTVLSIVSYSLDGTAAENLILAGDAAINGLGNGLANALTGNTAANTLNGGAGADTMTGKGGADTYVVDNAGDKVVELAGDAGTDTVLSIISYSIADTAVENLTFIGSADLNGLGNGLANALTGNNGANTLNGGTGADTMTGGAGSDTYVVDNSGDRCIEANGAAGTDLVLSTTSYSLAGSHLENLTLIGPANTYGFGNSIANAITGNGGANLLDGMGGADTLTGAGGADTFMFRTLADSGLGSARDIITDFAEGTDKIDLSLLDANTRAGATGDQAFSFINGSAFTGQAGQLRQVTVNGNTIVEGDVDGNRAADFQIQLNGLHTLQATDFVL